MPHLFLLFHHQVLSFNNAPDYENPMDAGMDNDYEITLVASDGSATGSVDIVVSVTDVDENTNSAQASHHQPLSR